MPAADMIQWAVQSFQQLAQARSIELTVAEVPENAWVLADSDAVHQALLNLLDNALNCTSAGGKVSIAARPVGGMVELSVADTGIGIAAKHIARAHGGDVRVESEPGRGTTFFFTLPAAQIPAALAAES